MGAAVVYNNEGMFVDVTTIWDNGYFFKGAFVPGQDNYATLAEAVACLTGFSLQMAERDAAVRDLSGYYTHTTGKVVPHPLTDKLRAWVRADYDLAESSFLSETEMQRRRTQHESLSYEDRANTSTGLDGTPTNEWMIEVRRVGGSAETKDWPDKEDRVKVRF
ncbi:hypothetical protein [Paenibacillus durus]|uniref:Uncharacterized protein n=1 Tax=Paenibacillus durus TaxID=44251 RepID=A0A089HRC0_PAEDU|nr:hypothetical protein [Paenibacillus durus]AIQ13642.1 hypothetical protein PDUR_18255 [Paenibacillus durus]